MELLSQLEVVEVNIEDGKATITFIDKDRGEIRDVSINQRKYDQESNKFIDDAEQANKAEEKAQRLFGVPFDQLGQVIGEKHDVYAYDKFNSLEPVTVVEKFDKDMVGQIIQTEVTAVEEDKVGLHIKFEDDGKTYQSNMNYAKYMEATGEWFTDPQKRKKQEAKFESKFHIPVSQKDDLVGKSIMVEVKEAFGKPYAEVKAFPKKKK